MNVKDAVVMITGGGSGLGAASAREFAQAGGRIVVMDLPSSPARRSPPNSAIRESSPLRMSPPSRRSARRSPRRLPVSRESTC